jgi:hypothetical protein
VKTSGGTSPKPSAATDVIGPKRAVLAQGLADHAVAGAQVEHRQLRRVVAALLDGPGQQLGDHLRSWNRIRVHSP